jgi:hypothetical protein
MQHTPQCVALPNRPAVPVCAVRDMQAFWRESTQPVLSMLPSCTCRPQQCGRARMPTSPAACQPFERWCAQHSCLVFVCAA